MAAKSGLRVATYPHVGFYVETLDESLRIAKKVDRANVGCSFNLCHWLKVDGRQQLFEAKLREAMPKLFLVSINGADAGRYVACVRARAARGVPSFVHHASTDSQLTLSSSRSSLMTVSPERATGLSKRRGGPRHGADRGPMAQP